MAGKRRGSELSRLGIDPVVYRCEAPRESIEVSALETVSCGEKISLVGRIMPLDHTGKISRLGVFSTIEGESVIELERIEGNGSSIPAYLRLTEENIKIVDSVLHYGDVVALDGAKSNIAGRSVFVGERITLLSNAANDVCDGAIDFRKRSSVCAYRYLQFIQDPTKVAHFRKCSLVFRVVRQFLYHRGFEEVNMPLLQRSFEAGLANPFVTRTTELNKEMFLRLSSELLLWRLMIAGFSKVFEIGKSFRNQGATANTLPQFTLLELYQAYVGSREMETLASDMVREILLQLYGSAVIPSSKGTIDCSNEFAVYDFREVVEKDIGMPYNEDYPLETLLSMVDKMKIPRPAIINKYAIATALYSHVMAKIKGPAFLRNLPAAQSPLYKLNDDKSTVDETLLIINGRPIVTIVNPERDPVILRQRMEEQLQYRKEKQIGAVNEDIITALKFGLPPCRGIAVGMEHLLMCLLNTEDIRGVELFPVF